VIKEGKIMGFNHKPFQSKYLNELNDYVWENQNSLNIEKFSQILNNLRRIDDDDLRKEELESKIDDLEDDIADMVSDFKSIESYLSRLITYVEHFERSSDHYKEIIFKANKIQEILDEY
jgi:hypothetical protein